MTRFNSIHLLLLACCFPILIINGFTLPSSVCSRSSTLCAAKRVKRGSSFADILDEEDEDDLLTDDSTTTARRDKRYKKKKSTRQNKNEAAMLKKAGSSSTVSSDLANWAKQNDDATTTTATTTISSIEDDEEDVAQFGSFATQDNNSNRAVRKLVKKLSKVLTEEKNNLQDILTVVRSIIKDEQQQNQSRSKSLNTILFGNRKSTKNNKKKRRNNNIINAINNNDNSSLSSQATNYRLAWVGGDGAICHVGTGLHRVPLARLQEIFIRFQGDIGGDIEMYEVISVFGPFPNVRNTLLGKCSVDTTSSKENKRGIEATTSASASSAPTLYTPLTIEWNSMIDGTGNEILQGNNERRVVPLQMYYADSDALIAVVPSDTNDDNPLESDGTNVLVFLKEDEMDEKLEALRVL